MHVPGFHYLVSLMSMFFDWIFSTLQGFGIPNYGLAILLLTIAIRTAVQPLSIKQAKSMRGLQEIQPKMKEIQEKFKSTPEEMQKRISALYKEHKVNPLMGCLPLLIQMPFLISLFYVLRNYTYITAYERFLWLPNLSKMDPLYILPVLVGVTTFFQMKLSMTQSNDQSQKIMAMIMPVFIAYVSMKFAAGLSLYWVFGNTYAIVYQIYFNWKTKKEKAMAEQSLDPQNSKKPAAKKKEAGK